LAGHSDADILMHALTDALLGAAGLGDIGEIFPPTDPQWKDAASEVFLRHARELLARLRIPHHQRGRGRHPGAAQAAALSRRDSGESVPHLWAWSRAGSA
jgi:hypothetical protein